MKKLLIIGITFNIWMIFYFKYVLLPLGISFFTFQQLSYIIDAYKGKRKGYHFIEYALFIIFFPQFVDDPIVLHNELISLF